MSNMASFHDVSPSSSIIQRHTLPKRGLLEEEDLTDGVLVEASAGQFVHRNDPKWTNIVSDEKLSTEPIVSETELDGDTDGGTQRPSNAQYLGVGSASIAESHTNRGSSVSNVDLEAHRPSDASTLFPPAGVHRRTQVLMFLGLIVGICCFVLLHVWFTIWNGELVGNTFKQQEILRVANVLTVCASAGHIFAIQKSYDQMVWRELKRHDISFKGLDKACTTSRDPTSFFNKEIWRTTRRSNVLAILCYLIPIAALFAPATLNVRTQMQSSYRLMHVPMLDIAQAVQYSSYAYAVTGSISNLEKYFGPRTIITRWAIATASTGEVPNLPPPSANATYIQTYSAPHVYCDVSTNWVIMQTDGMMNRFRDSQAPSSELKQIDYFAAVPALSSFTNGTGWVQVANLTDPNEYASASNEVWIYTSRYKANLDISEPVEKQYLTCRLCNASYTTRFTWMNGEQDLQVLNITKHDPVPYPATASTSAVSEVSMAYSSVMQAISSLVTGSIAFYKDLNATEDRTQVTYANRIYGEIATNVANTVLIGASDFNSHFAENHLLGKPNGTSLYSPQREQDMAYARDRPLEFLIPELSSNITLTLLIDPLLAPTTSTMVTLTFPANVYEYDKRSLIVAYIIASLITGLASLVGLHAIRKNRASHDLAPSSFICASQGVHFARNLRASEKLGALPLGNRISEQILTFGKYGFTAIE